MALPGWTVHHVAPLTTHAVMTTWLFTPVVTAGVVLAAIGYAACVWRIALRHPRHPWPRARSVAFAGGLLVIVVATQSAIGAYDDVLFSAHMVQHLLLIMVAPPLLVVGRPATAVLHAWRNPVHRRVRRILRSRAMTAVTWPPVVAVLYVAVVVCTHLVPRVMNLVLENQAAHDGEHALYLVVGYLFFLPLIGSEPIRWRLSMAGRYVLLLVVMPIDTAVGVALMIAPHELFSAYATQHRAWGPSLLADLHAGGTIMWIGSDLVMTPFAIGFVVSFMRNPRSAGQLSGWIERRRAATLLRSLPGLPPPATRIRPADVDDEATLAAYNAHLAQLDAARATPSDREDWTARS